MKLLGWMHRKFRPNGDPLKDFSIGHACNCLTGQPSLDGQQYHTKPNCGNGLFRQSQKDQHRQSFAGLDAARAEEDYYEEESSAAMSELFHGFLAIGTLGSDPANTDPSTPTFAFSVDDITEKETEVTENELKLINDELEKVLVAEAREEACNDSSARNSYVSAGRSSHGSTITLSGKTIDSQEANGNGTTICPLQGYLFGSAIEMTETTTVAKKENRISLGELFQRSKLVEANSGVKFDREDKHAEKEAADKSAVHLLKRIIKKKMLHGSSRSTTATTTGNGDPTLVETKLQKILQMFHRKVHPETSTTGSRKTDKLMKNENRKSTCNVSLNNKGQMQMLTLTDEDITIIPQRLPTRFGMRRNKSQSNAPMLIVGRSDSNGSRECWIKTDADYLVLEL